MKFKIEVSRFTSVSSPLFYAQTAIFNYFGDLQKKTRGCLYIVITLSSNNRFEGINPTVIGKNIISNISSSYYENDSKSARFLLKESVLREYKNFDSLLKVEICAAAYVEGVVFITTCGGGKAILLRNKSYSTLLDSKQSVISASGYPKDNDLIIVSSSGFLNPQLRNLFIEKTADGYSFDADIQVSKLIKNIGMEKYSAMIMKFTQDLNSKRAEFIENNMPESYKNPSNPKVRRPVFLMFFSAFGKWKEVSKSTNKNRPIGSMLDHLRNRKIYLSGGIESLETARNKKRNLILGFIVLGVLLVSIISGIIRQNIKKKENEFNKKIVEIEHLVDESISVYSLNSQRSRSIFREAKIKLEGFASEDTKKERFIDVSTKINENIGNILGEWSISPELFLDLSLISDELKIDHVVSGFQEMIIFDKTAGRVISVDMESKRTKMLTGIGVAGQSESVAAGSGKYFLLKKDGVYEISKNSLRRVVESEFSEGSKLLSFGNNLYVIDNKNATIKKFSGDGGGYGNGANWLKESIDRDLLDATQVVVDGSIWVVLRDGRLIRYISGTELDFVINGTELKDVRVSYVYTAEELKNIYVIDSNEKRILSLTKDGEYQDKYSGDLMTQVKAIVVSEELNKLFLFTENKIYVNQLN